MLLQFKSKAIGQTSLKSPQLEEERGRQAFCKQPHAEDGSFRERVKSLEHLKSMLSFGERNRRYKKKKLTLL